MKNSRTLGACLEDYRGGEFEPNRILADFCGVTYRTASEWGKAREPKGEQLNLAWHFLDSHGHAVDAYVRLPEAVRYLGKLVAFAVLTKNQARELLDVNGGDSYLWRVLQGDVTPLRFKTGEITLASLKADYDSLLEIATGIACENGLIPANAVERQTTAQSSEEQALPRQADRSAGLVDDTIIVFAASQFRGLKPLLAHVINGGPDSVKRFRREVGGEADFYDVLDLIKGLSSQRAGAFFGVQHQTPRER
jgi:hypothetical protein